MSFGFLIFLVGLALIALGQASEDGCGSRPLAEAQPVFVVLLSQRTFLTATSGERAGRYAAPIANGHENTCVDAVGVQSLDQVSHGEAEPCSVGIGRRRGQRRADHLVADVGPVDLRQALANVMDPTVEPFTVDTAVLVNFRYEVGFRP